MFTPHQEPEASLLRCVANGSHSGAWLVLPSYMTYAFANDILDGLAKASGDTSSKPARAVTPSKDE